LKGSEPERERSKRKRRKEKENKKIKLSSIENENGKRSLDSPVSFLLLDSSHVRVLNYGTDFLE
jgi:hypothetical protein